MTAFAQWLFLEENARERNRFQSTADRVRYGKEMESKILNVLKTHGWEIVLPSADQDKFDKIDGTLVKCPDPMPVSLPAAIQVKYRDTGNDILMEVVWSFDNRYDQPIEKLLTGRDMKGRSKIYVSLDQSGNNIRVRLADEAKEMAKKLLEGLIQSRRNVFSIGTNQIRVVRDPRDGRLKINAFLDPNSFSWKKDYPVEDMWNSNEPTKELKAPERIGPKDIPAQMIPHIAKALETGSATFKTPNNAKITRALDKYVSKRGLTMSQEGENTILKKTA